MQDRGPGWPEAAVAIAFVAFTGLALWLSVDKDKFLEVWAGVGTLVGIVTGAIPAYFFARAAQSTASQAQVTATEATATASTTQDRLTSVLAVAPTAVVEKAKSEAPAAWRQM